MRLDIAGGRAALVLGMVLAAAYPLPVPAETAAAETASIDGSLVTVHAAAFLTPEEVAALRLVLTSKEALALFVPEGKGHAAMAVSPEDGFIREGALVKSATAIAGMDSAEGAADAALKGCDAAREGKAPCVLVLEVAPE